MKRKLFAIAFAAVILASLATNAFAADNRSPYERPYDIETGKMFECVATESIADTLTRATNVGKAYLYGEDPLFGYPRAYAYTEANQTSYKVRAKCDVNNDGQSTASTGWREMNNTTSCNSGTIEATTAKCTFTGFHEIQVTATSAVASIQSSKSY